MSEKMKPKKLSLEELLELAFGTKLEMHCFDGDSRGIRQRITDLFKEDRREILEDYTNWLCDKGYTDSDVWSEEPIAVDRYLDKTK